MTRRNAVGDFIIGTGMLFREGLLLKFPLMSKKLVNKTSLPYFGVKLRKKLPIVTLR